MIQVISYIGQTDYYIQAKNHYEYLVFNYKLLNPNMNGWEIKDKVMTMKLSQVCVSRHYCWHMTIDVEW